MTKPAIHFVKDILTHDLHCAPNACHILLLALSFALLFFSLFFIVKLVPKNDEKGV